METLTGIRLKGLLISFIFIIAWLFFILFLHEIIPLHVFDHETTSPINLSNTLTAISTLGIMFIAAVTIYFTNKDYKQKNSLDFEKEYFNKIFKQRNKKTKDFLRLLKPEEFSSPKQKNDKVFCTPNHKRYPYACTYECFMCSKIDKEINDNSVPTPELHRILSEWERFALGVMNGIYDEDILFNTFGGMFTRYFFRLLPLLIQNQNESRTTYAGVIWLGFKWMQRLKITKIERFTNLGTEKDKSIYQNYDIMQSELKELEKKAMANLTDYCSWNTNLHRYNIFANKVDFYKKIHRETTKSHDDFFASMIDFRKRYCLSQSSLNKFPKAYCIFKNISM